MQITLESQPAEKFATEALVTYVFESGEKDKGAAMEGADRRSGSSRPEARWRGWRPAAN